MLEALSTYLVCHDSHHLNADQIALGMWPFGGPRGDVSRKTVHNYLSGLRGWIGAEHLPDAASAGGYLVEGSSRTGRRSSAWPGKPTESTPSRPGSSAPRRWRWSAADLSRASAVDGYDWVDEERLVGVMTRAIVDCATRLGIDLMDAGELHGAQEAAEAGLRGAPNEYVLWELGARAISARGERTALERWLSEAAPRARLRPTSSGSAAISVTIPPQTRSAGRRCAAPLRPGAAPSARRRRGARGPERPRPEARPRSGSGRSGRRVEG